MDRRAFPTTRRPRPGPQKLAKLASTHAKEGWRATRSSDARLWCTNESPVGAGIKLARTLGGHKILFCISIRNWPGDFASLSLTALPMTWIDPCSSGRRNARNPGYR